jgi:hypothetical protein
MLPTLLLTLAVSSTAAATPAPHACAADARAQAQALLVFHTGTDKPVLIDDEVRVLPSIANPAAPRQRFDVLETRGHLYKATYRIRLLYAQLPGPCVLMGQEILEHSRL